MVLAFPIIILKESNDAIEKLASLSSKDPNFENDKVNFYLAECYYEKDDLKNAVQRYNNVSGNNDELGALALYGKAYCYFNQREYENAAKAFSDSIKEYPDNSLKSGYGFKAADKLLLQVKTLPLQAEFIRTYSSSTIRN